MRLGRAQIDITPPVGCELSGFAARIQPSTGVLDRLFAKALFLEDGSEKLLWIHCDLIGFDRSIVTAFRQWARGAFGLLDHQILLSATHTHSGPSTIRLHDAGAYDVSYVEWLLNGLAKVAENAMAPMEECQLVTATAQLPLAIDRRKKHSAHTDPTVTAIGFRRADGTFAAVMVNYAMHPVGLGAANRAISAEFPGHIATTLAAELPGEPLAFFTNGACANLNPPREEVDLAQIIEWGRAIAHSVMAKLLHAPAQSAARLCSISISVPLALDFLDEVELEAVVQKSLNDPTAIERWNDKYRRTVKHWQRSILSNGSRSAHREVEVFAFRLGDFFLLGVEAEIFSVFTAALRLQYRENLCVIGYANGDVGYLSPRVAYAEGGYEVDQAHFFYGGFRFHPSAFEQLVEQAGQVLKRLRQPADSPVKL